MASIDAYDDAYSRALRDPEVFWAEAAEALPWQERWTTVLDRRRPPFYRWFSGGLLNTCYCAVDRHANGPRADQLALIYDSPVAGEIRRFTYRELRDGVARVAGALRNLGVSKGDRVLIFMPNTPEAVMTMLASARLGAVHSVVFLAGERADPDTIQWAEGRLGVPVIDHWWQTETGWPICANPVGLAKQPSLFQEHGRRNEQPHSTHTSTRNAPGEP